jgi:hypothetical protein
MLSTMRAGLKNVRRKGLLNECRLMRERREAFFARFAPLPQ